VWKWIAVHHFDFVTGWQEIKIDRLVENFCFGWFVCLCLFSIHRPWRFLLSFAG